VDGGATADGEAAGWRAFLVGLRDEGEPLEVVVLCPGVRRARVGD
jgi:hypothetical protein